MTDRVTIREAGPGSRAKAIRVLVIAGTIALAIVAVAAIGNIRINLTPSEPLGLWRIVPLDRQISSGDLIFICPPDDAAMREARERDYLRFGLCDGGFAPLIKIVIATPGQHVTVADSVRVDGRAIEASRVRRRDGQGRPLAKYAGGGVLPGMIFLHSSFSASFDSRYFGPLPASGILGLAEPVLIFAP